MIRKSMPSGVDPMGGDRFSEKIMLKQRDEITIRSDRDFGTFLALKIGTPPAVRPDGA
jgi:hypothetical protein